MIITAYLEWDGQGCTYFCLCSEHVLNVCLCFWWLQETKPSSEGAEKKDGEYIKLKVIGQVRQDGLLYSIGGVSKIRVIVYKTERISFDQRCCFITASCFSNLFFSVCVTVSHSPNSGIYQSSPINTWINHHYNMLLLTFLLTFFLLLFQDNSEIHFKVKMTTHLKKLKESYSQRQV